MSYDPVIRTDFLAKANSHELVLRELSDKFIESERKEHSYIDEMYHDILDLARLVYCHAGTYSMYAMEDIVHELACDIITRYKTKEDYFIWAWYKYIRLVLLRFRDNYIKINSSQVYEPQHNDERTIWHRTERTMEDELVTPTSSDIQAVLGSAFNASIIKLSSLVRINPDSPNYFSSMIRLVNSVNSNPVHSRFILNEVRNSVKREVI